MSEMDQHDEGMAWTEIWKLKNGYYAGLEGGERTHLISVFHDLLDWTGSGDDSETTRPPVDPDDGEGDNGEGGGNDNGPADDLDIHDPRHYLFGEAKTWIPWAEDAPSGSKQGTYANGYPKGIVLHWTAGHRDGLKAGNDLMRDTGMLYLLADKDGNIAQSDSLAYHGYHAGKSSHPNCSGYVSDEFCGLEVQAAGTLTKKGDKFYSWFNTEIPAAEVMYSKTRGNIDAGYYHVLTEAQMLATRKLCCWLYLNNPRVFKIENITSHDEVSPGRKPDMGASMVVDGKALTIEEFRELIESDIEKILDNKEGL